MANAYRSRPYRMTARRRAALRKAQLASAKKRRRRRNTAIAGGILAGGATAAYIGYAHGDKAANIAVGLAARTPNAATVRKAGNRVRSASQPLRKEANRIRNGLTKGFRRGAGPEAGQSAPAPRPRNTSITDWDRWNAQQTRNKMNNENQKNQSLVFGEGPASRKDEWGNGRDTSMRGIPGALRGETKRRLSGKKISSLVDQQQWQIAKNGGEALDLAGRQALVQWHVKQGTARGTYRGKLHPSWGKPRKRLTAKQKQARAARRARKKKS
jgi:hypothetical protein